MPIGQPVIRFIIIGVGETMRHEGATILLHRVVVIPVIVLLDFVVRVDLPVLCLRIKGRSIAIPFAAIALAGCAQVGSGGRSEVSAYYRPSLVNYVARDGTFPMVVHGDPFGLPARQTADTIRGATTLPAWAGRAELVNSGDPSGLRLVVIFNPVDPNLTARSVCGDLSEVATGPPNGGLHALASFCRAGEWITNASVRGTRPESPQDPALHEFMSQVVLKALPFHDQQGPTFDF